MKHITSYINCCYGVKEGAQLERLVKKLCDFILKQIDCYGADMGDKRADDSRTTVEYRVCHHLFQDTPGGDLWRD